MADMFSVELNSLTLIPPKVFMTNYHWKENDFLFFAIT